MTKPSSTLNKQTPSGEQVHSMNHPFFFLRKGSKDWWQYTSEDFLYQPESVSEIQVSETIQDIHLKYPLL